ncbi:hypothetical protein K3174_14875 [Qipengyuania sp. 6D47A]|uniref:Uncharacterized protein n=1 Tax=Qipengyuania qiaonensis TaxID=2867240 RepID=A0ABS7J930_9SPHN|nr:hypothetical protein [Qipengyuania qiaonensis]
MSVRVDIGDYWLHLRSDPLNHAILNTLDLFGSAVSHLPDRRQLLG